MKTYSNEEKTTIALIISLALLIAVTCSVSLFTDEFYAKETLNWKVQALFQDGFNLFVIVPLLVLSLIGVLSGNNSWMWTWGGTLLYLIYTYVIYCFDVHYNSLFLGYCLILGLSFYSFVLFLYGQFRSSLFFDPQGSRSSNVTGIYFIFIAMVFAFLWLAENIRAVIQGTPPASLLESGLTTNPVHIIDLSVILPAILITGILILRKNAIGFLLTMPFLIFFILMDATICGIMLAMMRNDLNANAVLTFMMAVLSVFSFVLLRWFSKANQG
jgi:hypothetical protein